MHRQSSRWIDAHTDTQIDSNKAVIDSMLIHKHRVITKGHVHTHTQMCTHTKEEGKPFFGIKLLLRLGGFALTTELNTAFLLTLTWTVTGSILCSVYVYSSVVSRPQAVDLSSCGNYAIVGYSSGHVDVYNMQSGKHRGSFGKPVGK